MSQYPPYETCNLGYAHILPEFVKSPWISIKDGLPQLNTSVLAWQTFGKGKVVRTKYSKSWSHDFGVPNEWCGDWHLSPRFSHWMPLPEPPKCLS